VLAIVLGPLAENSFRQSMLLSQGDATVFFQRPISLVCILCAVGLVAYPFVARLRARRAEA
jgi:putative tricarboxylic transport membrane protein